MTIRIFFYSCHFGQTFIVSNMPVCKVNEVMRLYNMYATYVNFVKLQILSGNFVYKTYIYDVVRRT